DHELVSADAEGFGHALENSVGDHRRVTSVADILEEHHELITAEAGDGVSGPEEGFEPLRERREQLIADRMAEAVVDDLEAVDVEEQDGEGKVTAPARDADGSFEAILEERAAGKAREPVEEGVAAKLLLGSLSLRDVG